MNRYFILITSTVCGLFFGVLHASENSGFMSDPMRIAAPSEGGGGLRELEQQVLLEAGAQVQTSPGHVVEHSAGAVRTVQQMSASAVETVRIKEPLCDGWTFQLGEAEGAEVAGFDDSAWRSLDIPHDWSIEQPFDRYMPNGNSVGYLPGGIGWYRKSFAMPTESKTKCVFIDFDGVYMNSQVWINGHLLGAQPYGYTSFRFDLTPYLNFGDKPNVIAVRVNAEHSTARWYPGAGIYRRVWLTTVDPVHVDHWGTYVTTPEITETEAKVRVRTQIKNAAKASREVVLTSTLLDPTGEVVAERQTVETIAAGQGFEFDQEVTVAEPRLWSVDTPNLYQVLTTVAVEGEIVDDYVTTTGIRSIEFTVDRGFFMNGEHVDIKGMCLHHDFGCIGTAFYPRAMEWQLEILREMGCNAIRTSTTPFDPEFYAICDRMGFLVMDDILDEWKIDKLTNGYGRFFDEWSEHDVSSLVRRDRNHPSIVIWSVGNEVNEQYVPEGGAVAQRLVEIVKQLDPTRPVTSCFNSPVQAIENGLASPMDVLGLNYKMEYYDKYKGTKPMISTESATSFSTRGSYPFTYDNTLELKILDVNNNIECSSYGLFWGGNRSEETLLKIKNSPWMAGHFGWVGIDYIGECFPFGWPSHTAHFGLVDMVGFPKDQYYLYQSAWTDKPMVHIMPQSWNFQQYPVRKVPVRVFSNCDEVELFWNGQSLGTKTIDRDEVLHCEWLVTWKPGELKAIARNGGKEVCFDVVRTANEPANIVLEADRSEIVADGWDLSYVEVRLEDVAGTLCPDADMKLDFSIEGEGTILGVASGNSASVESFKGNSYHSYRGLCRVVIKSTKQAGKIRLTAQADGLDAVTLEIESKEGVAEPYGKPPVLEGYSRKLMAKSLGAMEVKQNLLRSADVTSRIKASASSSHAAHPPEHAIDGDPQTRWCPPDGATGHSWQVDLGDSLPLSAMKIVWQTNSVYQYLVEGSTDGKAWFVLSDQRVRNTPMQTHQLEFSGQSARYLRVTTTRLPEGLWGTFSEVELYH